MLPCDHSSTHPGLICGLPNPMWLRRKKKPPLQLLKMRMEGRGCLLDPSPPLGKDIDRASGSPVRAGPQRNAERRRNSASERGRVRWGEREREHSI